MDKNFSYEIDKTEELDIDGILRIIKEKTRLVKQSEDDIKFILSYFLKLAKRQVQSKSAQIIEFVENYKSQFFDIKRNLIYTIHEEWNKLEAELMRDEGLKEYRYDSLREETEKYNQLRFDLEEYIRERYKETVTKMTYFSYPVLRVLYSPLSVTLSDSFGDSEFVKEFTSTDRHPSSKHPNYGYILDVIYHENQVSYSSQGHAVCLVRLYPFSTVGTQAFLILDSFDRQLIQFSNVRDMIQFLRDKYKYLRSFYLIDGDLSKLVRRNKCRALIQQLQVDLLSSPYAQELLKSTSTSSSSSSSSSSSLSSGSGAAGGSLGGGKTYFYFR